MIPELDATIPDWFPNPANALSRPNGLLAYGGDLSPPRLLGAYARGIFPWYQSNQPILWWSPDPRCIFSTETLRPNRHLWRQLKRHAWQFSINYAFKDVIHACARSSLHQIEADSWIGEEMSDAYLALHVMGYAHSVEIWDEDRMIGGIYGVAIGRLFFGESMFSYQSGGSRTALNVLAALLRTWGFPLLDAQLSNPHLLLLGAREMPRSCFLEQVCHLITQAPPPAAWKPSTRQPVWPFLLNQRT